MDTNIVPDTLNPRRMSALLIYVGTLLLAGIIIVAIGMTSSDSSMPPNTRKLVLTMGGFCLVDGVFAMLLYLLEWRNAEKNVVLVGLRLKSTLLLLRTAPFVIFVGGAAIYLVSVGAFGPGTFPTVVTVVAGILIALNLWGAFTDLRVILNPRSDSVYKALANYGDPQQVIDQIDSEMRVSPTTIEKTSLTKNWIVYIAYTDVKLVRLVDIVWLYGKHISVTVNSSGYNSDAAVLFTRGKHRIELEQRASTISELVRAISLRTPWALAGYDKNLLAQWNSNPSAIIATVDKRRGV